MKIFGFLRSVINAVESAMIASENNGKVAVAVTPTSAADVYNDAAEDAIANALEDARFKFRSLNALQKAAGGISRDEVREIVFSIGGRQSSDGQELYTLS